MCTESNQLLDFSNSADFDLVYVQVLNIIKRNFIGKLSIDEIKDCVQHAIIKYDEFTNRGRIIDHNISWLVKVASYKAIDEIRKIERYKRFKSSRIPTENKVETNLDNQIEKYKFIANIISNNVLSKKLEFELFYHIQELGMFDAKVFAEAYNIQEFKAYKLRYSLQKKLALFARKNGYEIDIIERYLKTKEVK